MVLASRRAINAESQAAPIILLFDLESSDVSNGDPASIIYLSLFLSPWYKYKEKERERERKDSAREKSLNK